VTTAPDNQRQQSEQQHNRHFLSLADFQHPEIRLKPIFPEFSHEKKGLAKILSNLNGILCTSVGILGDVYTLKNLLWGSHHCITPPMLAPEPIPTFWVLLAKAETGLS
jgi:hypothetical protein